MTTVLLYVLGAYVAVCWLWGIYLAVRLYTGRRVWQLVRGRGIRPRLTRATRATHQDTGTPPRTGAPRVSNATVAKAAAAAAKSRAA